MLLYAWFAVLVVDKQRARAHTLFELSTQQTRGPNSVRALEYPNRRRQRARNHERIVRGLFDVLCMCGVVFFLQYTRTRKDRFQRIRVLSSLRVCASTLPEFTRE